MAESEAKRMEKKGFKFAAAKVLTLAASGPAAITLLGNFGEKIKASELLTRIVLGWRAWTGAIWDYILSFLQLKIWVPKSTATITILILVPTIFQLLTKREPYNKYIAALSILSCALMYASNSLYMHGISLRILLYGLTPSIFIAVVIYEILYSTNKYVLTEINNFNIFMEINATSIFAQIIFFLGTFAGYLIFNSASIEQALGASIIYMGFYLAIALLLKETSKGNVGPLYIVAVASGIYAADWTAHNVIPAIEEILTKLGA